MITNDKEIKESVSVVDIIKENVDLTRKGASYQGLCPFHNEKTPSFSVSPNKGIYKCFGCGASGDGVQFLMDHKGMTYPEALEYIARMGKVNVEYKSGDRDEWMKQTKELKDKQGRLKDLFTQVHTWLWNNSWQHISLADQELISFAGRKYTWQTIKKFQLAWAPNGNVLTKEFPKRHWVKEYLLNVGIIKLSEHGAYDTYRERYLFPITDHLGNIIAMGGRKLMEDNNKKNPKYINSHESDIYDKSNVLYGLSQNLKSIRKANTAILVEGYTDVVSLSQEGVELAVASCGTALTPQQAKLIKRYADEVIILRDGDGAGYEATTKDVIQLLKAGAAVHVAILPTGEDPDSFIRKHTKAGFDVFLEEEKKDGLIWRVMEEWDDNNVFQKEKAYNLAGQLLSHLDSTTLREQYIRELTKKTRMGSVRKILTDRIEHSDKQKLDRKSNLNDNQQRSIIEFGLYQKGNRYFVTNDVEGEGFSISNFVVNPIMLIIGANASQRLVEISNEYGKKFTINADAATFTSLTEFKKATERLGNFLFTGKPEFYERVKAKVYRESKDCFPIMVMGLHREGFYTWGNGISIKGRFYEVNKYGVVEYDNTRYFLPAFSAIQDNIKSDDVDEEFEFEKKFAFYPNVASISFQEWSRRMVDVHDMNGAMAVAFACAALFRDVIFIKFQFFPHLNMFGPSGSGKSFLARSVMALFGRSNQHDPFNLASGTPVAFKRRLAQVSNGVIWFDEYSNDVDFRRVEALKGAYDGAGHEKGIASQDNRTKTTKIKSALMLTGQQQPTKDIALFKRVISLNCKSGRNTIERQQKAKELKKLEENGQLTQVTQYLLQYRGIVEDRFSQVFEEKRALINALLDQEGRMVEDRIVNNHLIPLAVLDCLNSEVELGFDTKEFFKFTYQNIIEQSDNIFNEDELSIFWRIVEYLHQKGLNDIKSGIHHNKDILIQSQVKESFQNEMNTKEKKDSIVKTYTGGTALLYIRFATLHPEYQDRHQRQRGKNGLDLGALKYYLKTSPAYEGRKRSKKFGRNSYNCFVFRLDLLPIELPLTIEVDNTLDGWGE